MKIPTRGRIKIMETEKVTLGEALESLQRDIPKLETISELKNALREIVKIIQVILAPEKHIKR